MNYYKNYASSKKHNLHHFFYLWDTKFFRFDKAKDRNSFKNSQFRGGGCMYVNFIATNHCC